MRRFMTAVVLIGLLVSACGDDEEDSADPAPVADDQGDGDQGEDEAPDSTAPESTVPPSTAPPVDDPDGTILAAAVENIEGLLIPGDGPAMQAEQKTCFAPAFVDELGLDRIVQLGFADANGDPFTDGSLSAEEEVAFVDVYFACVNTGTIIAELALAELDVPDEAVSCIDEGVGANETLREELRAAVFGHDPPPPEDIDQAMGTVVTGCLPPDLVDQLTP